MDPVANKFLTYAQAEAIDASGTKPIPYAVRHSKDDRHIFFVAVCHSYDPAHFQFAPLRYLWQEFVHVSDGQDRIALTEGGTRPAMPTETQAILQYGEQGAVSHWAKKANIPLATPEPPHFQEVHSLIKIYPVDAIMYYYFARDCVQWHRFKEQPDFITYMQTVLDRYKKAFGWNFDFSVAHLIKIHQKLYKTPFDQDDFDFFNKQADPTIGKSVVQKVARDCTRHRDVHIVGELKKLWQAGKSIFSAYGSTHVYMLEPAIRDIDNL